jgi:hypothetical protein
MKNIYKVGIGPNATPPTQPLFVRPGDPVQFVLQGLSPTTSCTVTITQTPPGVAPSALFGEASFQIPSTQTVNPNARNGTYDYTASDSMSGSIVVNSGMGQDDPRRG